MLTDNKIINFKANNEFHFFCGRCLKYHQCKLQLNKIINVDLIFVEFKRYNSESQVRASQDSIDTLHSLRNDFIKHFAHMCTEKGLEFKNLLKNF